MYRPDARACGCAFGSWGCSTQSRISRTGTCRCRRSTRRRAWRRAALPLSRPWYQARGSTQLARAHFGAACQVLLKGYLPLPRGVSIAVIGPHANASAALMGNYLGQICPDNTFSCVATPFHAIRAANAGGKTVMAHGVHVTRNDTHSWGEALALAAAADQVIMLMGIDASVEGEEMDRRSIDLPRVQHALIAAVGAVARRPVAVVLINGGPVDVAPERDSDDVAVILEAFYPGVHGSDAIAATLFGDNDQLSAAPCRRTGH
jgi:hypothetical protein